MVLIIKRLVPVYSQFDDVPMKYRNLRKAVYVTSFKYLYPNIPEILIRDYGLEANEKIVVFWMKEVTLPHFNRYRTKFRKVYSGRVDKFGEYVLNVSKSRKLSKAEGKSGVKKLK